LFKQKEDIKFDMDVNVKSPEKENKEDDDKKWSSGKKKIKSGNKLIKLIPCNSASNSPEVEPQEDTSDENERDS